MKTYIVNDCEIITNDNGAIQFARHLLTGKFIKHALAEYLLKYSNSPCVCKAETVEHESNHIAMGVVLNVVLVAVCLSIVIFLSSLSVAENSIILFILVALRLVNVANVKIDNLSSKKWSV